MQSTALLVASRPVDPPGQALAHGGDPFALERMPDMVALTAHLGHLPAALARAQRAGVVGLAAAGGVERGAVQRDALPVDRDDLGFELPLVGVGVVEQFGIGKIL